MNYINFMSCPTWTKGISSIIFQLERMIFSQDIILPNLMEKLAPAQYSAAFAVTETWRGTSREKLYAEFIIFKSPQHSSPESVSIKIGSRPVKQTSSVKFLGVLLDENLSWKYHLTELSKKLARTCGMFFKVRQFLPINVLICLYNSLFSPFLQYGILVWGLTYETYTNPVFLL